MKMKDKRNSVPLRVSPEFADLIKEIQIQKAVKERKISTSPRITKGITKWKGITNLKKALIDEW